MSGNKFVYLAMVYVAKCNVTFFIAIIFITGNNFIYELPASFTKLKALKKCQLSKNRLDVLPEDFGSLVNLRELYLDTNGVNKIYFSMVH